MAKQKERAGNDQTDHYHATLDKVLGPEVDKHGFPVDRKGAAGSNGPPSYDRSSSTASIGASSSKGKSKETPGTPGTPSKEKRGFFGKMKDNVIGTKEEREEQKRQQAERERKAQEQFTERRRQMLQQRREYLLQSESRASVSSFFDSDERKICAVMRRLMFCFVHSAGGYYADPYAFNAPMTPYNRGNYYNSGPRYGYGGGEDSEI